MRAFRHQPPEPGAGTLLRPRLVEALLGRFDKRVVAVVAPAGYGKSTALAHALSENALVPRGFDVWLACEAADADAEHLASALGALLGITSPRPGPDAVADAVWQRAPLPLAIVLDDVHEIPTGSTSAAYLDGLLEAMPANGHLVLASREEPPVRLARLDAQGAVVRLGPADLLLTEEERGALSSVLGADPELLAESGGWPAVARLVATAGRAGADRFVWEEVLARLRPDSHRAMAHLVAIGGADDEVATAVLGEPARLATLLAGVPLVASSDGRRGPWWAPHALWQPILAGALPPTEAAAARRAAGSVLRARGDLRRAAELLLADPVTDDAWSEVADLLVEGAALLPTLAHTGAVGSWLDAVPPERRDEPEALVLAGAVARSEGRVGDAASMLRAAWDAAGRMGRTRAELAAMTQLSHVAWWQGDLGLFGVLVGRAMELEREAVPGAAPLGAVGRALFADASGDFTAALAYLGDVPDDAEPDVAAPADFLRARALVHLGRSEEGIGAADRGVTRLEEPMPAARIQALSTRWQAGRLDEVIDRLASVRPGPESLPRDRFLTNLNLATATAFLGRTAEAEAALAEARRHADAVEAGVRTRVVLAGVDAAVRVASGDEAGAHDVLVAALSDPLDLAALRPVMGMLGFVHVLVPASRQVWEAADLGPDHLDMRATATTLLDARAGAATARTGSSPDLVLVALGLRWAMELAALTCDEELAAGLLARCGGAARARLRDLAADAATADGARALLRRLPASPEFRLRVRLLGPPAIERNGVEALHPDWRRERVRSLLCLLVARRRVTHDEVAAALWPDLDGEAAASNLRTTLGYLHKVLEPGRDAGDAPFFVRAQRDVLELAPDGLTADVWELEEHLDAALAAEAAGTPSVALAHYEAAIALWRGEHLDGLYDDWAGPERDRLRSRFLAASVRAGELLVAKGEIDRALLIGTRAVETEPWSEPAHRLVIVAHLARGDRSSARRALDRCHRAVADLGAEPEPETVMLERSVLGAPA